MAAAYGDSILLSSSPSDGLGDLDQQEILRVLLVEDSATYVRIVRKMLDDACSDSLTTQRYQVETAATLVDGIVTARRSRPDLVLLDLTLPDSHGLNTYRSLRDACEAPIIVLTGNDEKGIGLEAARLGAQDFLPKAELTSSLLARSIHYAAERARLVVHLRRLAWFDELTGLRNRRGFFERAEEIMVAARRHDQEVCAVYLDLNDLKRINDQNGHGAGDAAIVDVSRAIATATERLEERGARIVAGRLGGDEFCIVAGGRPDVVIRELGRELDAVNDGRTLPLSVSAGRASARGSGITLDDLLLRADADLYEAKRRKPPTSRDTPALDPPPSMERG